MFDTKALFALAGQSINFYDPSVYDSIESWFCEMIVRGGIDDSDAADVIRCWLESTDLRLRSVALAAYSQLIIGENISTGRKEMVISIGLDIANEIDQIHTYPVYLVVKVIKIVRTTVSCKNPTVYRQLYGRHDISKLIHATIFHDNNCICRASRDLLESLPMTTIADTTSIFFDLPPLVDVIVNMIDADIDSYQKIKALEVALILTRNMEHAACVETICSSAVRLIKKTDRVDRFLLGALLNFFVEFHRIKSGLDNFLLSDEGFADEYCEARFISVFKCKRECQQIYMQVLNKLINTESYIDDERRGNVLSSNLTVIRFCLDNLLDNHVKSDYLVRIMHARFETFMNIASSFVDLLKQEPSLRKNFISFVISRFDNLMKNPKLSSKCLVLLHGTIDDEADFSDCNDELVKFISHEDWIVRENVLRLICKLDCEVITGIHGIIPLLICQLEHYNAFVRRQTYQIVVKLSIRFPLKSVYTGGCEARRRVR